MRATNLSRAVWNSIADLSKRFTSPREVYFSEVTKSDAANMLIWCRDFGDVAIPLVAFHRSFAYYDTVPTGVSGSDVTTQVQRREDVTHTNRNFLADVVVPVPGDLVVILDPWGAKRFPMAIGLLHASSTKAWADN